MTFIARRAFLSITVAIWQRWGWRGFGVIATLFTTAALTEWIFA